MDFQRTRDPHEANIQHLRDTASARVEGTSLRRVAREIGMSPTGLKKFLLGTAPYSPTLRRLRKWYLQYGGAHPGSVGEEEVGHALALLTQDLHPGARLQTTDQVLESLARGYDASGRERPALGLRAAHRLPRPALGLTPAQRAEARRTARSPCLCGGWGRGE
jgi:transcriptional regulator with XRE-family HTH domain